MRIILLWVGVGIVGVSALRIDDASNLKIEWNPSPSEWLLWLSTFLDGLSDGELFGLEALFPIFLALTILFVTEMRR
jgi:hypothetical protein